MACIVRKMELPELEIAAYLAYKEGWNPGIADGWAFYKQDPNGFFIAEIDSRVVGCISAVKYADNFGFIGFYVVDDQFRNTVAGTQLGLRALSYLEGRNIGIDGVLNRVENYKRIGFKFAYNNARYEGVGGSYHYSSKVVPVKNVNIGDIYEYDQKYFPSQRHKFLDSWFEMPNSHTLCYTDGSILKGYGTIRSCRKGFKIGPLFADSIEIANELYKGLSYYAIDELIYIDVPIPNTDAVLLTERYDMKKVFETARMYSNAEPNIDLSGVFGVTSFELG